MLFVFQAVELGAAAVLCFAMNCCIIVVQWKENILLLNKISK
jgi:hypothetical protein